MRLIVPKSPTSSTDQRMRATRPTVVCLGAPVAGSRIDRLLRALPAVLTAFPNLVLEILGDGTERRALEHLAYALGVQSAVRFGGRIPPARQQQVLASAWVAVDPVGSAATIRAALHFGIPVVTEARSSTVELIRDGSTGWVVDSERELGTVLLTALKRVAQPPRLRGLEAMPRRAGLVVARLRIAVRFCCHQ